LYEKILTSVLALLISMMALFIGPTAAIAVEPVHSVHGHAVYSLDPPAQIDQITINAAVDADGVVTGSMAVYPSVYLAPPRESVPDYAGWTWHITINSLTVTGNVARLEGVITSDNRVPDNVGCPIGFVVTDNGSGALDPPDGLEIHGCAVGDAWIVGGNFIVK
jgi:hypothetical protein